jgi:hypothetical protein
MPFRFRGEAICPATTLVGNCSRVSRCPSRNHHHNPEECPDPERPSYSSSTIRSAPWCAPTWGGDGTRRRAALASLGTSRTASCTRTTTTLAGPRRPRDRGCCGNPKRRRETKRMSALAKRSTHVVSGGAPRATARQSSAARRESTTSSLATESPNRSSSAMAAIRPAGSSSELVFEPYLHTPTPALVFSSGCRRSRCELFFNLTRRGRCRRGCRLPYVAASAKR